MACCGTARRAAQLHERRSARRGRAGRTRVCSLSQLSRAGPASWGHGTCACASSWREERLCERYSGGRRNPSSRRRAIWDLTCPVPRAACTAWAPTRRAAARRRARAACGTCATCRVASRTASGTAPRYAGSRLAAAGRFLPRRSSISVAPAAAASGAVPCVAVGPEGPRSRVPCSPPPPGQEDDDDRGVGGWVSKGSYSPRLKKALDMAPFDVPLRTEAL